MLAHISASWSTKLCAIVTNSLSDASPSILSSDTPPRNLSASTAYSFPTASPRSLSTVTFSDVIPANSETSLNTRGNSITSTSPSGSGYSNPGYFEQLKSGHGTSANGTSRSSSMPPTLSPIINDRICGGQSLPNSREMTKTLSDEQHPFLHLEAQRAGGGASEPGTSVESDSHRFEFSSQGSPTSSSQIQLQLQDQSPYLQPRLAHSSWIEGNPAAKENAAVKAASQNILRADYLEFLETALPRWKSDTFWTDLQSLKSTVRESAFSGLALAYSSVCQLEIRMVDDAIRNRMALIRLHLEYTKAYERQSQIGQAKTIGRGGASVIIDTILESIHNEWRNFDGKRKSDLRVRFHDRKRYGKRWLLLSDTLGPSILFVCSSKMANMVYVRAFMLWSSTLLTASADTIPRLRLKNWSQSCCR